jgi:hypothetical protein
MSWVLLLNSSNCGLGRNRQFIYSGGKICPERARDKWKISLDCSPSPWEREFCLKPLPLESDVPGREWGGGGGNDPNIVCTYEQNKN